MTTKGSIRLAAFAALALTVHSTTGFSADAQRGQQFARRVCAVCHVVAEGQTGAIQMRLRFNRSQRAGNFRRKGQRCCGKRIRKCQTLR